jgi:hypothetical protein
LNNWKNWLSVDQLATTTRHLLPRVMSVLPHDVEMDAADGAAFASTCLGGGDPSAPPASPAATVQDMPWADNLKKLLSRRLGHEDPNLLEQAQEQSDEAKLRSALDRLTYDLSALPGDMPYRPPSASVRHRMILTFMPRPCVGLA